MMIPVKLTTSVFGGGERCYGLIKGDEDGTVGGSASR